MNVLAICNFDMKFIYAYLGVPGRAHDTKVLTHCARNEASFPHPPPGKYYLVDSGYPTRTGYLGPHRSMRYHLGQFARGGPPVSARELFNRKHSGLRSVIERTFGVWKAKWRILDRKHPKYGLVKWIKLVTATMALHNFIRDSHREDQDFVQWQSDDDGEGEEEAEGAEGDEEEGEKVMMMMMIVVVVDILYMSRPVIERWKFCVITSQMNMVEVVYRFKCFFFCL